ncbi:DUF5681 domain-containing protein [Oceanisphaera ostreae]|uniref:DUF5681 domain-containing protein n=1 Tax=Oceanisphaera ostreae TaxID=914151 RepID=A0ABW3KL77_9GAMM
MSRNKDGTFSVGTSGNPAGRTPGTLNRSTRLRLAIEESGDELIKVLLENAKAGDPAALKMALERIVSPVKPVAEPVTFELSGDTLTEQAQSILKAIAQGELDPSTGRQLLAAIADLSKITEVDELQKRLDTLEKHMSEKRQ